MTRKLFTFTLIIFLVNVLLFVFVVPLKAQKRYVNPVFTQVDKKTHTYFKKPGEVLDVDVYSPGNDLQKNRPLILYIHGGGFGAGKRDDDFMIRFCEDMAKRGYVAASIDYTLQMKGKSFGCERPAAVKIQTFKLTANDIARATAFFIKNKSKMGINPEQIVLVGSSAGAEAALHAVYWKDTYKNESGKNILPNDFVYGGVISLAGAIYSLDFIQKETAIPTQLFHGTCDNLVPYAEAPHHYCEEGTPGYLKLYGPYEIAEKLKNLGKSYYLYTACNGAHEWSAVPMRHNLNEITDFIYRDVIKKDTVRQIHTIRPSTKPDCPQYPGFDFCK